MYYSKVKNLIEKNIDIVSEEIDLFTDPLGTEKLLGFEFKIRDVNFSILKRKWKNEKHISPFYKESYEIRTLNYNLPYRIYKEWNDESYDALKLWFHLKQEEIRNFEFEVNKTNFYNQSTADY
jgi:hypothetical protein